jgi:hypothetical protein
MVKGQRFPDWKEVEWPSCILFQIQCPILLVDQLKCNYASRQSPEVAYRMSEKLCFRNESRTPTVNPIRVLWYWGPQLASRQNREARFDFLIFDFWFSDFWQPCVPAPLFLGYASLLLQ